MSADPLALSLRIRSIAYDGRVVLRDIALDVARGEIVGVAGHVGAGKSTLALAAAGLLGRSLPAAIDGSIAHPLGGTPPAAFVFANPSTQLTELGETVEEEVAVGPENQALESSIIRARVEGALALASASPLAVRLPRELSGGELQRVALASALALDAPLLVLDEPTAQLDPEAATQFASALRSLRDAGVAILIVEQNLELLAALADRVIVLADGAELARGAPLEVLGRTPPIDARLGGLLDGGEAGVIRNRASAGRAPLLIVQSLSAGYAERVVLQDLSLTVGEGEVVAWIGKNGAGKSTLARAIMGLVVARAGRIGVASTDLTPMPVHERARFVGLVFQDPRRQLFSRTILEEAMFGPRTLGATRQAALAQAREALAAVGLDGREREHPGDLAPQLQRRLAIASALASRPRFLMLDEPTAGQDAEGRGFIGRALELQRTRGAAAVITHDLRFAQATCDHNVTINPGHVSHIGRISPATDTSG
ncbi:MAG TPA: ATP-binding cassette domain-containing protein [Gemmatimonadaceae bacterium]|nr:ATP-binding cassette domain-containing protein [Gemmatimonadaceae bacterium]